MLRTYLFFFTLALTTGLWAQPVNDDCAGIINLAEAPYCSNPGQYTNVGATPSDIDPQFNIPACFNSGGVQRDVWFQFSVPADGSIVDVTVAVTGNENGGGTLENPQVAVYRGDCAYGELSELDCASAPNGTNSIALDLFGLTPGFTYFIRINDYSATASPNAGTFQLCVNEYVAEVIMGQTLSSASCSGTLYDSGGPAGDYQSGENLSFTVCPQDFHQCIVFNVETYNVENEFDFISFYQGATTGGVQITELTGGGANLEVQITGGCATVGFTSDGSVVDEGFKITWTCSPNPCSVPPIVTCDNPVPVPVLPFNSGALNNCFSGNSITNDPCGSGFIQGNDYVFTYTSAGDECIRVTTSGTGDNAGVGVYSACPTEPGAQCVAVNGGFFGVENPGISAAFLENPGTYYIVFATAGSCSPFTLVVDTITCPVLLPPASTCDQALNIGGCSTVLPEIIALNPGDGDPGFIQQGVNQGCFLAPQFNYSFFYFKAGADGKFGFTVQAADPNEASDIDINVWGPIDNVADICEYTANNQPVRSTWAPFDIPTGLQDIHPTTGINVTDDFDCGSPNTPGAGGDNFVRMLDVEVGKYYVILLDDFGQAIENGGIAIDFNGTAPGVLTAEDQMISAGPDTTVCAGQPVQLFATGGAAYSWGNDPTLSCNNCATPLAFPIATTTYQVQVAATCGTFPVDVTVKTFDLDLGPDASACTGASFQINPNPNPDASYQWTGNGLSCSNCPTPTITANFPGVFTYFGIVNTPFCTILDTLIVTIFPGAQPQYLISGDTSICVGQSVSLGGVAQPGTTYSWTSVPAGFTSTDANPVVAPTVTTKYYLTAGSSECQVPALDSILVTVSPVPNLVIQPDTMVCQGEAVQLANIQSQSNVTYQWTPSVGTMNNPNIANPVVTPQVNTTYTLQATLGGCTVTGLVEVEVIPILLQLNTAPAVRLCKGQSLTVQANVSPAGTPVLWSPTTGLQIGPGGGTVVASPLETTLYTATVAVPGCTRTATVAVLVDSLPTNLDIIPADTTICVGSQVQLLSTIYNPGEYEFMEFLWLPFEGQLTPDSFFNMVVQPEQTTIYRRITKNGACLDTAFAVVNVIVPPDLTATPDTTICPNNPVQLSVTVPQGVTDIMWSPANGLSCTECNTPLAIVSQSAQFTVSGEFQGCPVSATASIAVLSPPPIVFPTDVNVCDGESVLLNLVADPGASYTWTSNHPGFPGSTDPQPVFSPTQTATYTVTATNGCPASGSVTIVVSSGQLTVSPDTAVCRNEPLNLVAMGTTAGAFLWSTGQTTQAIQITADSARVYTVTYTYGDGCTKTESVTVGISGESVPLELPMNALICPGESITLNQASVPSGAVYNWTATPTDPTLAGSAGNPTVSPAQTTLYSVTATLGNCTTTRTIPVNVATGTLNPGPDLTICAGDAVTLNAGASQGTLLWSNGATTPSVSVTPSDTTTYTVTLTYGNGCVLTESIVVNVLPAFGLSIIAAPPGPEIELGEALELTANVTPGGNLQGYTYNWLENGVTNIGTTQIVNTTITTSADTIRYLVEVTSPNGCKREAVIGFSVLQPLVEIPNAFTPDGDQTNDVFGPVVLRGKIAVESLEIFNRWGQKVFTATPSKPGWDGTVDGKPAPVDTYLYRISWRRGDGALQEPRAGEVTLLR